MITLTREEAQQVLDALQCATPPTFSAKIVEDWQSAVELLRARLSAPEPEPVARNYCREIYEVWAGSEGIPVPETAPEAYLLHLVEQMRDIAKEGLREKREPSVEPVAWMWGVYNGAGYSSRGIGFQQTDIPFAKHTPLYTAPPKREFIGLTNEEKNEITWGKTVYEILDLTEAKLKEKNT